MAGTELTCPVCLELFNAPVTLFCTHSLCTDCIRQSAKASTLRCPTCGEVGPIPPVSSLQINTVMQHHVDVMCGRVLPQDEAVVCDRCEVQQAEVACDQCDLYLCNPCNQAHHVGRVLKGHQVSSAHTAWWKQIPFCTRPDHERCRTDLLLVDTHQLVCRVCLQTDDRYLGRKCIKLAAVVDDLKQDIARWIEQTEACKLELKRVAQFVDRACVDVSKHTADEIAKFRALMQQLRAELDKQEQQLIGVATAAKETEVKNLSAVRWEAFERAASLNTELAKAQKILTTSKYADLVGFSESKPNPNSIALIPQPAVTKCVLRWTPEAIRLDQIAAFTPVAEGGVPSRSPHTAGARNSPRPPGQPDRRGAPRIAGPQAALVPAAGDVVRMKPHPLPGVSISYKDDSCIVTIQDDTGQHTVLSEEGWTRGKQYFDVYIARISDGSWIGVSHGNPPPATYVGAHGVAWGSPRDGREGFIHSAFQHCQTQPWNHIFQQGSTVGMLVDLDEGTLSFFLDHRFLGVAVKNLTARGTPLHLAVSNNTTAAQYIITRRPVPSAGLYARD